MQIPLEFISIAVVVATIFFLGVCLWVLFSALFTALILDTAPHYVTLKERLSGALANAGYTLSGYYLKARSWLLDKAYASARLVKLMMPWSSVADKPPFKFSY